MRAYLSFNLPEETGEHQTALNGWKYRAVIDDLQNYLRQLYKYEDKTEVSIEVLREKIVEIERDYDLFE